MFALTMALTDRLGLEKFNDPELAEVFAHTSWRKCATDRSAAVAHIAAKIGSAAAKGLNLSVANGAQVPAEWSGDSYLTMLSKEGKAMRWLACTMLPGQYAKPLKTRTALGLRHGPSASYGPAVKI